MTVVAPMGKVEQAMIEAFEKSVASLPGTPVVEAARREALGRFATLGLPSRRVEAWRYTDLKARIRTALPPLATASGVPAPDLKMLLGPELALLSAVTYVFVNGRLQSWDHGPLIADDPRLEIAPLHKALASGALDLDGSAGDVATLLNTAFASDGAVIRVTEGARLDVPLHLIFVSEPAAPAAITVRNRIEIGRGARLTIVESHVGAGNVERQTNALTDIRVGEKADVAHIKLHAEGPGAMHLGTWQVTLAAGCRYRPMQMTESPGLARNQLFVAIDGEEASIDLKAATLVRGHEHADTTLVIDHKVPHGSSREHYKAVLDGEAHAVFQGKVIVRPGAQKTDGKQMAQALMLSETAEFSSKPELEIYADDVACGHGSTSTELDEDQLFYLRARGVPADEAKRLLTVAFIAEPIMGVEDEAVREALMARAQRWLEERKAGSA
ncbi:MAG: Fe-S cluster assembly protein SufD [Hyphomicrobiaceae bacterium]